MTLILALLALCCLNAVVMYIDYRLGKLEREIEALKKRIRC